MAEHVWHCAVSTGYRKLCGGYGHSHSLAEPWLAETDFEPSFGAETVAEIGSVSKNNFFLARLQEI